MYKCPRTGFLTAYPPPSTEERVRCYRDQYFQQPRYSLERDQEAEYYKKVWLRRITQAESTLGALKGEKALLDIGAGTGEFCEVAAGRGWNISVVEFSEHGRAIIRKRLPQVGEIHDEYRPSDFSGTQFDLITLWAVIEHMPYDPTLLPSLYALLRPGGTIAFSFPNPVSLNRYVFGRHWRYFRSTEHVAFYPPALLKHLLGDVGFTLRSEAALFSRLACVEGLSGSPLSVFPSSLHRALARGIGLAIRYSRYGDTYELMASKPRAS